MGSYMNLAKGQAMALKRYLDLTLPKSLDETSKLVGDEDAFKMHNLRNRLATIKAAEDGDDE